MPARRLLVVGLWLVVTASATAVVWAGTSTVAANLTDRPAPVVAHREVVVALQSGAADDKTAPGITTPNATFPPTEPTNASTSAPAVDSPLPGPDEAQASAPQAPTTVPPAPPPPAEPTTPPTTQPPSGPTATYSMTGGVVTVACKSSYFIELVSATPNNGYTVVVANRGPFYVEVHFVRPGQDDPVWAYCLGQPIRAYGEPPRPG